MTTKTVQNEPLHSTNRNRSSQTPTPFSFYSKLSYPLPDQTGSFSRTQKSERMEEYLNYLNQHKKLFPYLPFVQEIFLANSITFNALKAGSDIDLFIITDPHRIRTARLLTSLILRCTQTKRSQQSTEKRFCLSFFISSEAQSLQELLLNQQDIYLPYRIAHLVPIYQKNTKSDSDFWSTFRSKNLRIQNFLPNRTPNQKIFLDLKKEQGSHRLKKRCEKILSGKFGNFIEELIITLRTPLIQYKKNKKPELHQSIILSNTMLKFHHDKRAEISQKVFW